MPWKWESRTKIQETVIFYYQCICKFLYFLLFFIIFSYLYMLWRISSRTLNVLFTIVTKMTLTFSRIIDFDDATKLFLKQVYSCAVVDACLIWTDLIILISRPVRWDKLYQSTHSLSPNVWNRLLVIWQRPYTVHKVRNLLILKKQLE